MKNKYGAVLKEFCETSKMCVRYLSPNVQTQESACCRLTRVKGTRFIALISRPRALQVVTSRGPYPKYI